MNRVKFKKKKNPVWTAMSTYYIALLRVTSGLKKILISTRIKSTKIKKIMSNPSIPILSWKTISRPIVKKFKVRKKIGNIKAEIMYI